MKHSVFPISLLKKYKSPENEEIRTSYPKPQVLVSVLPSDGEKTFLKILRKKGVKQDNKDVILYPVRYKTKVQIMMNVYLLKK